MSHESSKSRRQLPALLVAALALVLLPHVAYAQTGNIAGTVRDSQGGALPGVTVEVTSPQLIEKVRTTVTDGGGRYQIVSLPVGTYTVTFKLDRFSPVSRPNVELSTDFTAPVNAEMKIGAQTEVVTVVGTEALVDVVNARQRQVFTGAEVRDLPTTRNLPSLVQLVPGIAVSTAIGSLNSVPVICAGGQADAGFVSTSGASSGCSPIQGVFNAHSSMNDFDSLNQGRIQVDGLGVQSFGGGGRSSYISDIAGAQEITFTLSGSLGESETGGTTINIVPRTGGNRYAGNFFTAYSDGHFFGKNNETRPSTFVNRLESEYDVNGSYGGPIIRDRLWFHANTRRQERNSILLTGRRNENEGIFGANFKQSPIVVGQDDIYQNVSLRLTVQATQRDKFNVSWDEQYTCENPCHGVGIGVAPEAQGSLLTYPLHLAQVSWSNPLTNRILLDAGFSHYGSHRNETQSQGQLNYPHIPRVSESGAGADFEGLRPLVTTMATGSINNAAINWNIDNFQTRASASYVTGSHNVKFGYQGQYLGRISTPGYNDMRLNYTYATPASTCTATAPSAGGVTGTNTWCGLRSDGNRNFDGLPVTSPLGPALASVNRPPVPTSFTQYIPANLDEKAWFTALYLQDQWTMNRFTLSGSLRYDNAQSKYGKTCVGPDLYTQYPYCLNDPEVGDGKGVYFQDITPRWGVSWDVFGNGKTAIKYSQGKYLGGSQVGGIYTASNQASGGRTVNSLSRTWRDLNGNRIVDCDLTIPQVAPPPGTNLPANGECGAPTGAVDNARRFGRSPDSLDELGLATGLNTIYCGMDEPSMAQSIRNYCNSYFAEGGHHLLSGWNARSYEWQLSVGVQHELLPRLSMEVTYNRRTKGNILVDDDIGEGCDLYQSDPNVPVNRDQCMQGLLNYQSPHYDFYSIQAPVDARLPRGGGYVIPGFASLKQTGNLDANGNPQYVTAPAGTVSAFTIAPAGSTYDLWSGIDTNFTLRARGGLRITGGTSTGRRNVDTCGLLVDNPPGGVVLREGQELVCSAIRPMQTNVRGTATYTIPWVDLLTSAVFSYRPGVNYNANYTIPVDQIVWNEGTVRPYPGISGNPATVQQNLVSNDSYGEGIRIVDLKFAKNIRFAGKRANVGVDVYNVFNSDAALGYCSTYANLNEGTTGCDNGDTAWRTVEQITTPRYVRFQVQFDF